MKCGDTDEVRPSDFTRFSQSEKTYTTNYQLNSNNNSSTISPLNIFIKNATYYNTVNSNINYKEILEYLGLTSEKENNFNFEESISKTTKPLRTYLINNFTSEIRKENEFTTKAFTFENIPKTNSNDRTKSSLILSTIMFPTSNKLKKNFFENSFLINILYKLNLLQQ